MKVIVKHINAPRPVEALDLDVLPNIGDRLVLPSGLFRVRGRVFYPEDAVALHVEPTTTYCDQEHT